MSSTRGERLGKMNLLIGGMAVMIGRSAGGVLGVLMDTYLALFGGTPQSCKRDDGDVRPLCVVFASLQCLG